VTLIERSAKISANEARRQARANLMLKKQRARWITSARAERARPDRDRAPGVRSVDRVDE
jgi:hypothetical protein